jgi:hypothetical protein
MDAENLLKMSGVQSILMQLIEKAAPQLHEHVNVIAGKIVAIGAQLDRIEANQNRVIELLELQNADPRRRIGGPEIAHNGAGKQQSG